MITPDSSVAIAAAASWHVAHDLAIAALEQDDVTLIAHVAYETTAALSRMPEGHRITPAVVVEWIERRFQSEWLTLPPAAALSSLRTAVEHGIRGGALYDALVAATAAHHRHTLVTADRRAAPVYQALGATVTYVGEPQDRTQEVKGSVIPGVGHWVAEEAPEEMLAALTAFLGSYRDGAAVDATRTIASA